MVECPWQERKKNQWIKELSFYSDLNCHSACLCNWTWCFDENHWNTKARFSCSLEWNIIDFEIQTHWETKAELYLLLAIDGGQSGQCLQRHKGAVSAYYFSVCMTIQDRHRLLAFEERAPDYKLAELLLLNCATPVETAWLLWASDSSSISVRG